MILHPGLLQRPLSGGNGGREKKKPSTTLFRLASISHDATAEDVVSKSWRPPVADVKTWRGTSGGLLCLVAEGGAHVDADVPLMPAHTGPSFAIEAQSSPFAVMQALRLLIGRRLLG